MNVLLIAGLIVLLIFAGCGAFFVIFTLLSRKKAQKAAGWRAVNGTITATEIKEHTSIDDEDGIGTTQYEPVVHYSYAVGGQTYTGKRIGYGFNRFDLGTARKKLEQYPQGSSVEVRYNPEKPEEAVLETTVGGSKVLLIVGMIFLVIGLCGGCGLLTFVAVRYLSV